MKGSLRAVALVLLGSLGLSAVWLTWTVVRAGAIYADDPRNVRAQTAPAGAPRGRIVTADGVVVAEDGPDGERRYPGGPAYAHLVGFDDGTSRGGLELTRFPALQSRDDGSITAWIRRLMGEDLDPPDVRLTLVDEIQQTAVRALDGRTGAVVAIDPRTGAVLAYVSSPSFDPDGAAAGGTDPSETLPDRAADRVLPPGSTFKVIVAAAALEAGLDPDSEITAGTTYTPPTGEPIANAGGRGCGVDPITLTDALVVSCNTAFARLAVDLGAAAVVGAAESAGFNTPLPWETGAAASSLPSPSELEADPPALAQTGIGERDVRASPLLMATIAAAIANEGIVMAPHSVAAVVAPDGEEIDSTQPQPLRRAFAAETAARLGEMMAEVVERGTGSPSAVDGVRVAGKTGTAEGSGGPHAWFIGFAPAEDPTVAVAVVVEGGGSGGRVAGPVAAAVIAAALGD